MKPLIITADQPLNQCEFEHLDGLIRHLSASPMPVEIGLEYRYC